MAPSRMNAQPQAATDQFVPAFPLPMALGLLVATAGGALAAVVMLPAWLPGISPSLGGPEPKAFWYLSRASALVAYGLLWLSMLFGLGMTSRLARLWPGGPTAFDLHQHTSLLGLAFGLFHALILLGDRYVGYTLRQLIVPFAAGAGYRPVWVGLGQLGWYLLLLVGLSFYVRGRIGRRAWRLIHSLSFLTFALALLHGIGSGTDSAMGWIRVLYWSSGGTVLWLTGYRLLVDTRASHEAKPRSAS